MKPVLVASLALSLSSALPAVASDDIRVMTLNQYLGGDLGSLIAPPGGDFNAALLTLLEQIAATDFPARVERQAREIARRKPHLVGLQEVLDLSCADLDSADGEGCEIRESPMLSSIIWTRRSLRLRPRGRITSTSPSSTTWT